MVRRLGGCVVTPRPWLAGVEEAELCLKRCFSLSGSIPSSLEGDADCPPCVQDVRPVWGTSGQRTASQWCWGGQVVLWMVFVCGLGGEGRKFPIAVAFPPTS